MTPLSFRPLHFAAIAALCLLPACADDGTSTTDTGTADTGTTDTGATDARTADGSDDTGTTEPLAIAGAWVDDFDGGHTITSETWDMQYALFHVASYDNDAQVLIAQNDDANEFSGGLWSRFDWTHDGAGKLWFCQNPYDAQDAAAAAAAARADDADPATGGCNGFAWSGLNAPPAE